MTPATPESHQIPARGTAKRCPSHPGGVGKVLVISPPWVTPLPTACGAFTSLEPGATAGPRGTVGTVREPSCPCCGDTGDWAGPGTVWRHRAGLAGVTCAAHGRQK